MWRYQELLPLLGERVVSLDEGWTPLTAAPTVSAWADARVQVKNETTNPTWSFKDRFNALLVSNAIAAGQDRIAASSTGNHGASTAAYASIGDCTDTIILLHPDSEQPARVQVRAYGAQAVVTSADGRAVLLDELVDRGWYPATGTSAMPRGNPYGVQGYKTIAYEIVEQRDTLPTAVTVPTGSGDGLYGVWRGFQDLRELGVITDSPRMVAVQPRALSPLVDAFDAAPEEGADAPDTPPLTTSTASDVVGAHALAALEESNGTAVRVTREVIEEAIRRTAADGIYLEPASALATAGAKQVVAAGLIERNEPIVGVGTGAGVTWPNAIEPIVGTTPSIEPTWTALADAFALPDD